MGSIITSRITPLMILQTFLEQLIPIWHLSHHDSHSFETVPHSSLSQVIDKPSFHLYPIFPMMSHCVSFITHFFLIYHLIHHTVLRWNFLEYFSESLLSNCLQIPELLLSHSCFLLYIKRLSCLRERTLVHLFSAQLFSARS